MWSLPRAGAQEAIITMGSISFPEKRTHVETIFLKDDSQDDFQTLRKVKKLLLCRISLRNHVVRLVGTIAPSSLGVGSFPSPYGYVDPLTQGHQKGQLEGGGNTGRGCQVWLGHAEL